MTQPIMSTGDLDAYLAGDPQTRLDAATAAVRAYCGWHVAPEVTEAVTVWAESSTVILPTLHIVSLTSVTLDGDTVDLADCEWETAGILRLPRAGRWCDRKQVVVGITHGYASASDIQSVIASMVQRASSNPLSASRMEAAEYAATLGVAQAAAGGTGFTSSERATLDRYKLPPRP